MTGLGLIEMTRKKTRQGLDKAILVDCGCCGGTGRVFSPLFIAGNVEKRIEKIVSAREGKHSFIINSEMAELFSNDLKANISVIEEKWNVSIDLKANGDIARDEIIIVEGEG
jgi:ribonuclease G